MISTQQRAGIVSKEPIRYEAGKVYEIESDVGAGFVSRGWGYEIEILVQETLQVRRVDTGEVLDVQTTDVQSVPKLPEAVAPSSEPILTLPDVVASPLPDAAAPAPDDEAPKRKPSKPPRKFTAAKAGAAVMSSNQSTD
jgi:hypothetical protein